MKIYFPPQLIASMYYLATKFMFDKGGGIILFVYTETNKLSLSIAVPKDKLSYK